MKVSRLALSIFSVVALSSSFLAQCVTPRDDSHRTSAKSSLSDESLAWSESIKRLAAQGNAYMCSATSILANFFILLRLWNGGDKMRIEEIIALSMTSTLVNFMKIFLDEVIAMLSKPVVNPNIALP